MVLQIWEEVGKIIQPVELQCGNEDSQLNITYREEVNQIMTHKICTRCELEGDRQCAGCGTTLGASQLR
eukprot:1801856-Karenia_brevis.AAC.1